MLWTGRGGLEFALHRVAQGHRLRFYRGFYGRQWVSVADSWMFWRSGRIYLDPEEVQEVKRALAHRDRRELNR